MKCTNTRKEYEKEWRTKNKEKMRIYMRDYAIKNVDKIRQYQKDYRKTNNKWLSISLNKRRANNVNVRIANQLRVRIGEAIRRRGQDKKGSAISDLGCTIPELLFYLEGKFQDGMTWENWGTTGWHIDHIIPLAFFDLSDREQFLRACHYTNLQPLWAMENYRKAKKLV